MRHPSFPTNISVNYWRLKEKAEEFGLVLERGGQYCLFADGVTAAYIPKEIKREDLEKVLVQVVSQALVTGRYLAQKEAAQKAMHEAQRKQGKP